MLEIAIFYGSTYGNTAEAAELIAAELGGLLGQEVPLYDVAYLDVAELERFDVLLIGGSTWNVGELQMDWALNLERLAGLELSGKRVALFGAGDQVVYHDSYLDALGILAERFEARGATLVGAWPSAGYQHSASRAERDGWFVGLGLDDDNQGALTASRVRRWCAQLALELAGRHEAAAV